MQSDCCAYLAFRSQRHGGTTILPEAVGFENAILLKEDGVELEAGDVGLFLVSGERAERASPRRSGVLVVLWAGLSPFPGALVFVRVFPSTSGFL